jgi:serralysin
MRMRRWGVRAGLTVLATIAVAAIAAPAQAEPAGYAYVSGTKVTFSAGEATNKVVITRSGKTVTIDDRVAIKPSTGCKRVKGDKTRVKCKSKKTPKTVVVRLHDRNDSVVNKSDLRMEAEGGPGNDKLVGGPKGDLLAGDSLFTRRGAGNDKIYGVGGNDEILAGEGADYVSAGAGDDTVHGDSVCECDGPRRPGNDVIHGGSGNDFISAMNGDDKVYGCAGNDAIYGGAGRDRVEGGSGDDDVAGDDYSSKLYADVLLGGSGNDTVEYSSYRKAVTVSLDGVANDGISGERDNVGKDVENIWGGQGNDRLVGNAAANRIDGLAGDDVILGGGGDDRLSGSQGRNRLYGEAGDDTLFTSSSSGGNTVDGGPNTDKCYVTDTDTVVNCEEQSNA